MLRIMICEEDKKNQDEWKQMIETCLFDKVEVSIECCENSLLLIEQLNRRSDINADLLFLDMEMSGMSGIELAKILRVNHVDVDIIFLARHSEYVFRGYEMHAYDYLLKPITPHMIASVLERYVEEKMTEKNQYLFVRKRTKKMRIPLKNVRYFGSDKRLIKVIFDRDYGEIDFYMKMEDLEEKLQRLGFVRCHQSYLVNIHKVLFWERSHIVLMGNEKIPVSRKYIEMVNEVLEKQEKTLR